MTPQRGFSYGVRHTVVSAPTSLLAHVTTIAANALELIELGSIYVNDQRSLNPSLALVEGAKVRIHTEPRRYPQPPRLLERIVREDDDIVVIDKPAGLPVHALVDNINENLISYLEDLRGGTLYITHRLDVETAGLVLLAKNPETQARLNRAFADGTVKRTYAAYTLSPVNPGVHVHYMEPSPKAPKKVSLEAQEGWLRCELRLVSCDEQRGATSVLAEGRTEWQLATSIDSVYRCEIELATGRPQQIRAQMAALGAPLVGDTKYGSPLIAKEEGRGAVALRAIAVVER